MKKFSRLAALLILSASFAVPLFVVADTTMGSDYCNSTGRDYDTRTQTCVPRSSGGGINISVIQPYADSIKNIINHVLMPVFMAIAFIVFLWGVFKYFIWGADNDTERATGRQFVLWGVIGFVIILSLWGLVNLVMGTLGFSTSTLAPRPPTI